MGYELTQNLIAYGVEFDSVFREKGSIQTHVRAEGELLPCYLA